MGLNLNSNFEFFRQKSRELLSFEFEPSSFTRNSESNYVRIEGRKNGCLRFFLGFGDKILDIYLENDPHKIMIWEKKYFDGKLFTRLNRLENMLKSVLWIQLNMLSVSSPKRNKKKHVKDTAYFAEN